MSEVGQREEEPSFGREKRGQGGEHGFGFVEVFEHVAGEDALESFGTEGGAPVEGEEIAHDHAFAVGAGAGGERFITLDAGDAAAGEEI